MKYFKEEMRMIKKLWAYFEGTREKAYDWDDKSEKELRDIQDELMCVFEELEDVLSLVWETIEVVGDLLMDIEDKEGEKT